MLVSSEYWWVVSSEKWVVVVVTTYYSLSHLDEEAVAHEDVNDESTTQGIEISPDPTAEVI